MPIVKTQSAAVAVGGVFTTNICEAKLLTLMILGLSLEICCAPAFESY
jgi:hypothetical protein